MRAKNPINALYDHLKNLGKLLNGLREIKSIVVFGSAARPEDFIPKVSDIDVLVITTVKPSERFYELEICGYRVDVSTFDVDELKRIFEVGDPLGFMLKHSVVILDDGTFNSLSSMKLRITEHTRNILRRSIFAALGLAVEKYFRESYGESISHIYHAVRHLIRYKACFEGETQSFPISDKEVYEFSRGVLRRLYKQLVDCRRRDLSESDVAVKLDKAIKVIASELNLKTARLRDLEKMAKGSVEVVTAYESGGYIVFRLEVVENCKMRVFEVKGGEVKEVYDMTY